MSGLVPLSTALCVYATSSEIGLDQCGRRSTQIVRLDRFEEAAVDAIAAKSEERLEVHQL